MGNMVSLDGGKRIRLDDKADFWPATGKWRALEARGGHEPRSGEGMPGLLTFLTEERERAGRPVVGPAPVPSGRKVRCTYCDELAELHPGPAVYPDRKDLEDRLLWVCWACEAWVGCHRGTDRPFGSLANDELRRARISAHAAFDPIWQKERLTRPAAYAWLAEMLAVSPDDCHIGLMDLEQCGTVTDLVWEHFGKFEL